jgi:hypothetical protein
MREHPHRPRGLGELALRPTRVRSIRSTLKAAGLEGILRRVLGACADQLAGIFMLNFQPLLVPCLKSHYHNVCSQELRLHATMTTTTL